MYCNLSSQLISASSVLNTNLAYFLLKHLLKQCLRKVASILFFMEGQQYPDFIKCERLVTYSKFWPPAWYLLQLCHCFTWAAWSWTMHRPPIPWSFPILNMPPASLPSLASLGHVIDHVRLPVSLAHWPICPWGGKNHISLPKSA